MQEKKFVVKDSGKRQEFSTGAVRDDQEDKGRYDLIPPIVEERLAKHYEAGAKKYGDNNFRLGIPAKRYIDSARRHLNKYRMGWTDEDHLIAAIWNIAALVETEYLVELGLLPKELLDGNYYSKEEFERIKKEVIDKNKKVMQNLSNEKYPVLINQETFISTERVITGIQMKFLAGIPIKSVIWLTVPGEPDVEISDNEPIDLSKKNNKYFYSTKNDIQK